MSIAFEGVDFAYGGKTILTQVDWTLPEHGIVCLWGASGSGKTTLLRLLAGLETPAVGRIVLPPGTAAAAVFQEDRLLPWRTVIENVCLPAGATRERAESLLRALEIEECRAAYPDSISGGQCRRAALARALCASSSLLLLDEPFTGLDESAWQTAVPLIREYAATRPVVMVTHVSKEVTALGGSVVRLVSRPVTGELRAEEANFAEF